MTNDNSLRKAMKRFEALHRHDALMRKRKQVSTFLFPNAKSKITKARNRRRRVAAGAKRWTLTGTHYPGYTHVQALRRGEPLNRPRFENGARSIDADLQEYMRRYAHRAPGRPASNRGVTQLFRGLPGDKKVLQNLMRNGYANEKGYSAFSSKRLEQFDRGAGFLRLRLRDIRPGTPYIWFADPSSGALRKATANGRPGTEHPGETETLLPPGRFLLLGRSDHRTLDVAFEPAR